MIKDSLAICGSLVPCCFVSPVDRLNRMWLDLLKSCEPEDLYWELEDFFKYADERATRHALKEASNPNSSSYRDAFNTGKAANAFYADMQEALHYTLKVSPETQLTRYVRWYLHEQLGLPEEAVLKVSRGQIHRLWLETQMRIIQGAGQ